MKKYALTALSLALISAQASADASFYGKANLSAQSLREETLDNGFLAQDNYELISNKSRFGVKGDEAINDPIKVIYQMEWEVAMDTGDTGSGQALKQRNTFVGLAGNWGTVMAGISDTPTKMINKPIDIFNDARYGDIENATVGEIRQKNMLMYRSPVWAGINFDVLVTPGEDKGNQSLAYSTGNDNRNDLVNAWSAAVTYQLGGFKIALGADSKIEEKLAIGSVDLGPDKKAHTTASPSLDDVGSKFSYEGETDLARLVASYDHPRFGVAGMLQHARQSRGDLDTVVETIDLNNATKVDTKFGLARTESLDTAALAGYVNITSSWKVKALRIQTRFQESNTQFDQTDVGVDYKLGKNTTLYGYVGDVKAASDHTTWGHNSTAGIGIDHNFAF